MVAWSGLYLNNLTKNVLLRGFVNNSRHAYKIKVNYVPLRSGSHGHTILIKPSTFQSEKFKDLIKFYLLLGIIPLGLLSFFVNIYIGPATIALIPDGYEPKHWEYYEHPITRFIAKYIVPTAQEHYERSLHTIYVEAEKQKLVLVKKKIEEMMRKRQDYKAWYFVEQSGKHGRRERQVQLETHENIISRGAGGYRL